jgi:hypothetical protein
MFSEWSHCPVLVFAGELSKVRLFLLWVMRLQCPLFQETCFSHSHFMASEEAFGPNMSLL